MEITGTIEVLGQTQEFGNKGFKKREVVINTDGEHSQSLQVEFHNDKCTVLDNFQLNQNVTVSVNVRGSKWTNPQGVDRYFVSLVGWKIN